MAIDVRGTAESVKSEGQGFAIEDFGTLDTQANRTAIDDKNFSWVQNFMPIGKGNLRTTYAETTSLYTASGKTIIREFPYNIGTTSYIAVFFSDGTAIQVRNSDGAVTTISATANLFYTSSSSLPDCSQWQSKYLIIAADVTANGYFVWNASALFQSGSLSTDVTVTDGGRNYSSNPTVTAYGGSGTGATFSATIADGAVALINLTAPGSGYLLNDQPVLAVSGGGSDDGAAGVASVDPTSGGVISIQVLNGGNGYTGTNYVTISGGGGSNAAAVISGLALGSISAITVINPGIGYTSAPSVTIGGSGGTGFTCSVDIQSGQISLITVAAGGSNYVTPPLVTISGDGSGATAVATLSGGAVNGFIINSAGTGYSFAQVALSGGNNAAQALTTLMPFGVSGNTVETYQARVWIADGTTAQVTAPSSVTNFDPAAGGAAYPATDSFLRDRITRYAASSGFLYQFGDSSVDVISNVQTSGNPVLTTFNVANVDPQTGTPWRDSVQPFGRALVFANSIGVYALYGGAAEKVSDQLDGLFANATFNTGAMGGITPSASVATFFGIRCYCLLFTTINPFTATQGNIMACWTGQKWFIVSQLKTPLLIATQEIDSQITSWASDGTHLYQMFQTASSSLTKIFQTKLRPDPSYLIKKQINQLAVVANNNTNSSATINVSVDNELQTNAFPQPFVYASAGLGIPQSNPGMGGQYIGLTGVTTAPDITLISMTGVYNPAMTNA